MPPAEPPESPTPSPPGHPSTLDDPIDAILAGYGLPPIASPRYQDPAYASPRLAAYEALKVKLATWERILPDVPVPIPGLLAILVQPGLYELPTDEPREPLPRRSPTQVRASRRKRRSTSPDRRRGDIVGRPAADVAAGGGDEADASRSSYSLLTYIADMTAAPRDGSGRRSVHFDRAWYLMDRDLLTASLQAMTRERNVNPGHDADYDAQWVWDEYCKRHSEKHGENFRPDVDPSWDG